MHLHSSTSTPYASQNQRRSKRKQLVSVQKNGIIGPRRGCSSLDYYIANVAKAALKIGVGASITTSALLALQLIWVAWKTPRLPPPPLSGADFVRQGRVVNADADADETCDVDADLAANDVCENDDSKCKPTTQPTKDNQSVRRIQREFRLVLVGDSPVEGIGNSHHRHALGGETACAFAKLVGKHQYDTVRYWSFGKSGLTASGIEKEMISFLYRVVHDVHQQATPNQDGDTDEGDENGTKIEVPVEPAIHAIVLLCGVNNVLDPLSTPASFHDEVGSLIESTRCRPELECTPLIVLGLPDFAKLPFLPWPLSFGLGLRGRRMQRMLEAAVKECQLMEKYKEVQHDNQLGGVRTVMVSIPEVQDVLGSIGYHRHDSSDCSTDKSSEEEVNTSTAGQLRMRLCHPLLKYLGNRLDRSKIGSLGMEDFLCDDGFHPGRYGTVYIGNLIAEAYGSLIDNTPGLSAMGGNSIQNHM